MEKENLVGKIFHSNFTGDAVLIEDLHTGSHNVKLKFINKNMYGENTIVITTLYNAKIGQFRDCYYPLIPINNPVAYKGNAITKVNGKNLKSYDIWHSMIVRCYNPNNDHYRYYGAKGVTVCKGWLCYEFFLQDIKFLENYELWKNDPTNYQLDKDILQKGVPDNMKIYSKETCKFVSRFENDRERRLRNLPKSGYIGVREKNGKYNVRIGKNNDNLGTYVIPEAAAFKYDGYARGALGYKENQLNNVPYMSIEEIAKYQVTTRNDNMKEMIIKLNDN